MSLMTVKIAHDAEDDFKPSRQFPARPLQLPNPFSFIGNERLLAKTVAPWGRGDWSCRHNTK